MSRGRTRHRPAESVAPEHWGAERRRHCWRRAPVRARRQASIGRWLGASYFRAGRASSVPGKALAARPSGTQTSTGSAISIPEKPGRATPTTVTGVPAILSVWPSTAGWRGEPAAPEIVAEHGDGTVTGLRRRPRHHRPASAFVRSPGELQEARNSLPRPARPRRARAHSPPGAGRSSAGYGRWRQYP